jgi:multidrug resistance efflux pump
MQASLQALTSQLDAHQINLDYWKTTLARDEKLFEARAIAKSALDATINRHAEAESRLASLKSQIAAQKAQISAVVSQKQASEKDVAVWQARLDYADILAPIDGIISARTQEEGNLVQPGVAVYTLEDVSMTRLRMQVPQQEAVSVRVGQAVTLKDGSSNGFVVSRIYPVQNELRQVVVEAAKPGEASGLVYDMQLPVRITVESRDGVLVPPAAAFIDFNDPQKIQLYVVEGSLARRITLSPLLRGDNGNVAFAADLLPAGTELALGNYLENVRLPASFSIEVIR